MNKVMIVNILRWSLLIFSLAGLAFAFVLSDDAIDRATRPFCPESWWHTSSFWAHCAFPPVSIAKHAAKYFFFGMAALLFIQVLVPRYALRASACLFALLMIAPASHLLLVKFSWVACASLFAISCLALVYFAGSRAVRSAA